MKHDDHYKRLFESANDAIFILNKDLDFVECNGMACQLLNREREDLIGSSPFNISPVHQPNGRPSAAMIRSDTSRALKGEDMHFKWVLLKNDGTEIYTEVSLFGFIQSNRKHLYAIVKDLTELLKKEQELKESEERFRTIYKKSTDGILILEPGVGFVDCNESVLRMLDLDSTEELKQLSVTDISPEFQPDGSNSEEKARAWINECIDKGQSQFEWVHLKKDGTPFWLDIVLTRIRYKNEIFIHGVWRDISRMKIYQAELVKYQDQLQSLVRERTLKMEKANEELLQTNEKIKRQHLELENMLSKLKEAQSQLIHSEKMATIGVLTAGVAHEINNPLNFILGGLTGLEKYFHDKNIQDKKIDLLLNSIKTGFERASEIVSGLSEFSRKNENLSEHCDVHAIIDHCLVILHNEIYNARIIKNYNDQKTIVMGNAGKLHQVFMNILINASQAIHNNGSIKIITCRDVNNAYISITDSGRGINKDILPYITDPFYTTKDPGKGTGLGLSIASSIVQSHKGILEFESIPDVGTTVKIVLPLIH